MRIGILETGRPSNELNAPSYAQMIGAGLGGDYEYVTFEVMNGHLPSIATATDAYVITGSSASVYNTDPWIDKFRSWLKNVDPAVPLVGFCFGHQIMADAFGGSVARSSRGLGVGLHEYSIVRHERWMDGGTSMVLPASHYDQVIEPPADAHIVGGSEFCPVAALSYDSRRAISFQSHPEFSREFTAAAIGLWERRGMLDTERAALARASMRLPDDRARVLGWIRRFFSGETNDVERR